jgi:hypothetical protein
MKAIIEFLGAGGWIIVVTAMAGIFFAGLIIKGMRSKAPEPGNGYWAKYDPEYDERGFDEEYLQELQDYPVEHPELTKEDKFLHKKVDEFMKRKVEEENTDKSFLG